MAQRGWIRKRGSTFTAFWKGQNPDGSWKTCSKGGFPDKDEAQKHLNKTLSAIDAGAWKPEQRLTVAQLLIDHWLPARTSRLRPSTVSLYKMSIDSWLVPHLGALDVRQLNAGKITHLADTLAARGGRNGRPLGARSVQQAVMTLMAATRWGARNGLLNRDPLSGFERPKGGSPPMGFWTGDQARNFLDATRDDRLAFVWALALTRGMRRGEIAGLRWDAIDLERGTAMIFRTRILVDGKAVDQELTKTARGRRQVPLDDKLVALLKAHRRRQFEERSAAGLDAYGGGGWLVADELGRPLYPDTISERFDALAKKHGLPRIRFHDCRHSCATLLLHQGVPVNVVADMLGHDPRVTLSVYSHHIPAAGASAGAALSAALLG